MDYILWVDVETSGTSPENDELLEVACVLTDMAGNKKSSAMNFLLCVNNLSKILETCSPAVRSLHEKSGLWKDLYAEPTYNRSKIDKILSEWIKKSVKPDDFIYFGGNSITLDRNFVQLNFPDFYKNFSYRSVDVTSISLTVQSNSYISGFNKGVVHRALPDVFDSIEEYKYYLSFLHLNGKK